MKGLNALQIGKTNKKQTFLGGAAVLALATAIVKIIGALYKIPIQHVIGEDGYGYFNSAYDIYSVLLMMATTGLPVAMSRMISEAGTNQNYRQISRTYDAAKRVFLIIGLSGTALMAVFCVPLADFVGQRNAWFPILCLSPAMLLICLTSVNRGFFQGQGDMRPTSISQVLEAICKLVIGLGLAVAIMFFYRRSGLVTAMPDGSPLPDDSLEAAALARAHSRAAGGAIIGVTIGCGLAAFYLSTRVRRAAEAFSDEASGEAKPLRTTIKELLKIAIPITIGAAGLQLINLVDAAVYMYRLKAAAGFSQEGADSLKGIYNYCQTIFNLPCAFITPIVIASIPALTEQITRKNRDGERAISESAIRVMSILAFPCAIGLACLSRPIYALLARHSAESLNTATPLLAVLGICVVFNSIVLVTNGIMQSHGDVTIPVIHMLIGGIVKIIVNFILVGNPDINILGAPIGTVICYTVISALNLLAMNRKHYPVNLARTMLKPLIAALLMGVAAWYARLGLERLLAMERFVRMKLSERLETLIVVVGSILAAVVVYVILVLLLKVVTKEDCALLPKGEKIAKLLRVK